MLNISIKNNLHNEFRVDSAQWTYDTCGKEMIYRAKEQTRSDLIGLRL